MEKGKGNFPVCVLSLVTAIETFSGFCFQCWSLLWSALAQSPELVSLALISI